MHGMRHRFRDVVIVVIRNQENKLFIHQRLNYKKYFPLYYGLGTGGFVERSIGELGVLDKRIFKSIQDKMKFRLNIPYTYLPQYMVSFLFENNKTIQRTHVYHLEYDKQIKNNSVEFKWSDWLTIEQINKIMMRGKLCPDTEMLYKHWLYHENRIIS